MKFLTDTLMIEPDEYNDLLEEVPESRVNLRSRSIAHRTTVVDELTHLRNILSKYPAQKHVILDMIQNLSDLEYHLGNVDSKSLSVEDLISNLNVLIESMSEGLSITTSQESILDDTVSESITLAAMFSVMLAVFYGIYKAATYLIKETDSKKEKTDQLLKRTNGVQGFDDAAFSKTKVISAGVWNVKKYDKVVLVLEEATVLFRQELESIYSVMGYKPDNIKLIKKYEEIGHSYNVEISKMEIHKDWEPVAGVTYSDLGLTIEHFIRYYYKLRSLIYVIKAIREYANLIRGEVTKKQLIHRNLMRQHGLFERDDIYMRQLEAAKNSFDVYNTMFEIHCKIIEAEFNLVCYILKNAPQE